MTNREFINTLTNEELAAYIYVISVIGKDAKNSRQGVAEWLGMPKDAKYSTPGLRTASWRVVFPIASSAGLAGAYLRTGIWYEGGAEE